jgi:hypothetical protein
MIERDEELRNTITDVFTKARIDARNLAVEVVKGNVIVKGTVPSQEMLQRVRGLLSDGRFGTRPVQCEIAVRVMAPGDSLDGRGRSLVTGTSADSAHESRHQLDKT